MERAACLFLLAFPCLARGGGAPWGYGDHGPGPEHWSDVNPTCGLLRQSPIDIVTSSAQVDESLGEIALTGYDAVGDDFQESNNGHSVAIAKTGGPEIYIEGGGLGARYDFVQFHMHWGAENGVGSEHTVNGKAYPVEIHFVHKRHDFAELGPALANSSGLAVLGVFVEVSDESDQQPRIGFSARFEGDTGDVSSLRLDRLLPTNRAKFYRYEGSLTTPPCSEAVIWTVFAEPIKVTQSEIDGLRNLREGRGENSHAMVNNYRPVQAMNGRVVTVSVDSSAIVHHSSIFITALSAICLLFCLR